VRAARTRWHRHRTCAARRTTNPRSTRACNSLTSCRGATTAPTWARSRSPSFRNSIRRTGF
jgi:hypothetical protein